MTVGIGTGFDEEAVKRDLAAITAVEQQAEAEKSDMWCKEDPPRIEGRALWKAEEGGDACRGSRTPG